MPGDRDAGRPAGGAATPLTAVSHELLTPLTSICAYTELLGEGAGGQLTDAQRRIVERIRRNAERLAAMIEDLLTVSGIESGEYRITPAPTALAPLVKEAGRAVAGAAADRSIELSVEADPGLGTVEVDAAQLHRALLHLLANAIKFTGAGGRVALTATRDGDEVVIEVRDSGSGIPAEEQPHVFASFFRAALATELAVQGAGLGLALVKAVVDRHGGTVALASEPGRGTTVTVRLPA